ncbi:hypothetical protein M0811_06508 [Anaeramoeba ignava]|uniref:Uncharacterized protein n=1 Tax=Anaeramoeba ignava TaxID=1746090 RepID=A0A9Q0REZ5_ANAIG|nr:hypothetical protein M0811_06508 [Anaeramoeba ignava]
MFEWIFILISSTLFPFIFIYHFFYKTPFYLLECIAISFPIGIALSSFFSFYIGVFFQIYLSKSHSWIVSLFFFTLTLIELNFFRNQKRNQNQNQNQKKNQNQNQNQNQKKNVIQIETFFLKQLINEIYTNDVFSIALFTLMILFLYLFHIHFLRYTPDGRSTAMNGFADLPFHENIINSFIHGANSKWKGMNNLKTLFYSNEKFVYPIICNYHTALLVGAGQGGLREMLIIPSIMMIFSFITLLYFLNLRIFKSRNGAVISLFMFFFSGGLGFITFLKRLLTGTDVNLYEYNYVQWIDKGKEYFWWNPVDAMLPNQRTSLFGYPIVISIFILLWIILTVDIKRNSFIKYAKAFSLAGFLTGILPLIHLHCFFAVAFVSILLCIFFFPITKPNQWIKYITSWSVFGIVSNIIAFPQLLMFFKRATKEGFAKISPVWIGENTNPFSYLFKALGILLILSIIGIIFLNSKQIKFYISTLLLAIFGWIVLLQPWKFDNMKILQIWFFVASGVAANTLVQYWPSPYIKNEKPLIKFMRAISIFFIIIIFISSIFSGVISVLRLPMKIAGLHSNEDYIVGNWITYNTPIDSIFFTDNDYHASPVSTIAGRQIYFGFVGWSHSHGIDYFEREKKKNEMMKLLDDLENQEKVDKFNQILDEENISYIYLTGYRKLSDSVMKKADLKEVLSVSHITVIQRLYPHFD